MRTLARRRHVHVLVAIVSLLSVATEAAAAPLVSITTPAAGPISDSANVTAAVSGPYIITSVTAQIGAVSENLVNTSSSNWKALLDISGEPFGPTTLTVTATDAIGHTTSVTRALIHDHAPTLTVTTPDLGVARPSLPFNATCSDTDPYGCASIVVVEGSKTLASVNGAAASLVLDQTVSLVAYEGQAITLRFRATDSAGFTTEVIRRVVVESDPHLVLVDEVSGPVLDVDATRILFDDGGFAAIKDRASGAVSVLGAMTKPRGHLTSVGAVWTGGEVRNNVVQARKDLFDGPDASWRAAGDWILRPTLAAGGAISLFRENHATGAVQTLAASELIPELAIDANGTAVFVRYVPVTTAFELHRHAVGGPDQNIANSAMSPAVGGDVVLFQAHHLSPRRWPILLYSPGGGTETVDTTSTNAFSQAWAGASYRAKATGWSAYTKIVGNQQTAWTRSPSGVHALASPFAQVTLAGLNSVGELVHDVSTTAPTKRYIGKATATSPTVPLPIGGANGEMFYIGGDWYEAIGRSLFRVDLTGSGSGSSDAGVDGATDGGTTGPDASSVDGGKGSEGASPPPPSPSGSAPQPPGETSTSPDDEVRSGGCAIAQSATGPAFGAAVALGALFFSLRRRRSRRGVT